jgi:hypothetical protein
MPGGIVSLFYAPARAIFCATNSALPSPSLCCVGGAPYAAHFRANVCGGTVAAAQRWVTYEGLINDTSVTAATRWADVAG